MDPITSSIKALLSIDLRPGYVKEFHDAVRAAIRDGKLSEEEITQLEKRREELGLNEDVLRAVKHELYLEAFNAVKEEQKVTDDEWEELQRIQNYLGLSDTAVAATKKELYRMRILSELPEGNMPVVDAGTIILQKDEVAHWIERVDLVEGVTTTRREAPAPLKILPGQLANGVGSMLGVMKEEDERAWKKKDSGTLIITNKRLIFRGEKESESLAFKRIIDTAFFLNACRIHPDEGAPLTFKYRDPANRNVVGSVLLYAIHHSQKRG